MGIRAYTCSNSTLPKRLLYGLTTCAGDGIDYVRSPVQVVYLDGSQARPSLFWHEMYRKLQPTVGGEFRRDMNDRGGGHCSDSNRKGFPNRTTINRGIMPTAGDRSNQRHITTSHVT